MFKTLVRSGLLKGFVPAYAASLSVQLGTEVSFIVRNSALTSDEYSPLLSDLDLAAVGNFNDDQLKRLRSTHDRLRKILLFVGELEIYTPSEWGERTQLVEKLDRFYTPLRLIRKIRWMIRFIDTCNSLAALRAKRGFARAVRKLGFENLSVDSLRTGELVPFEHTIANICQQMRAQWSVPSIEMSQQFSFYHPLLELSFVDMESDAPDGPYVRVKSEDALLMAAVFPLRTYQGLEQQKLEEMRAHPEVRAFVQMFAKHELLVMTASVRGLSRYPEWYEGNLPELTSFI